jgi:predicted O-linked N-acetylglucosamine transferase (SPINDLY family)
VTQLVAARRRAALEPANAEAQQALALALAAAGFLPAALPAFGRAVRLAPASPDALINFGVALLELKEHAAAAAVFRRVLSLAPAEPDAHHAEGVAETETGRPADGERRFRRALQLRPGYAETYARMASTLVRLGRHADAVPWSRTAIALNPGRVPALVDLGVICTKIERHGLAVVWSKRALAGEPASVVARVNCAAALALLGRSWEAVAMLRQAAELPQGGAEPYRNMLAVMSYVMTDEAARWELTCDFGRRFAPPSRSHAFANSRDAERRLVVGYLSSDFYEHPVARNLVPVIEAHDSGRLATVLYSDAARADAMTARLQAAAVDWRRTAALSDADVASRIRADALDVLVIVGGRLDRNRPLVACHRAAPIQMSLFDAGTSGLEEMDYLIADRTLAAPPRLRRERYSERVLRLPSLYVHPTLHEAPVPCAPPCLVAGHVTFGCFNSPLKLSDRALDLWAEVMRTVPQSRLRLKYQARYRDPDLRRRILSRLEIDPARVDFLPGGEPIAAHLRSYEGVDVALDSFPFTGSTTTWEALWMGVPVVTLLGESLVGRLSASFLNPVGLGELVAATPEAFVRTAAGLARDPGRLAALRSMLRARVAASPLCDGRARARQFERLFRAAWRRWCGATVFG